MMVDYDALMSLGARSREIVRNRLLGIGIEIEEAGGIPDLDYLPNARKAEVNRIAKWGVKNLAALEASAPRQTVRESGLDLAERLVRYKTSKAAKRAHERSEAKRLLEKRSKAGKKGWNTKEVKSGKGLEALVLEQSGLTWPQIAEKLSISERRAVRVCALAVKDLRAQYRAAGIR